MDIMREMQRLVDDIETALCDDMRLTEVIEHYIQANSYLPRVFKMVNGIGLSEYVRNRRLSLAKDDCISSDESVLNIALQYGYETAESFTKAFKRFHGMTPTQARTTKENLRSYTKLTFDFKIKGGHDLIYRIEQHPSFHLQCLRKTFTMEQRRYHQEIPAFWQEFFKDDLFKTFCNNKCKRSITAGALIGVDEMALVKDQHAYYYSAAIEADDIDDVRLIKMCIPEAKWVKFPCSLDDLQATWIRIYSEFFPSSHYTPIYDITLELYYQKDDAEIADKIEIWVPIK